VRRPIAIRQFSVGSSRFRFALHHTGSDRELDGFVHDVEKIVREMPLWRLVPSRLVPFFYPYFSTNFVALRRRSDW
jgi:hypothetical protein